VLMLDLDDFKGLNDTLGCQIGDLLLVAAARRLEEVTRSSTRCVVCEAMSSSIWPKD